MPQTEASTKDRLLDAAERLFAEQGIEATSLRSVTSAADANLAAVHYHFGSKGALTEAVFSRRILPLNAERLERLDACERAAAAATPLEEILGAFFSPAIRRSNDPEHANFIRLMGRMFTEPNETLKALIGRQFEEVLSRFGSALERALPHLPREEVHWRLHFAIGAMIHVVSDPVRLERLTHGLLKPSDVDATTSRLIGFVAAGLRAPSTTRGDP